jgi:hypothetical protein
MMLAKAGGEWAGATFQAADRSKDYQLECTVLSEQPLERLELVVNGIVTERFQPQNRKTNAGAFENRASTRFRPRISSWLAWRCFEPRPGNRLRFAHTAPWYVEVPGKPLVPRRAETQWLVARVKEEIARSQGVAPEALIDEYRRALETYEELARRAE